MENLMEKNIGRVRMTVKKEYDECPVFDNLGKRCDYTEPNTKDEKLVHNSGVVLDHKGIWRDELGRIVAAPEVRSSRRYEFTFHNNGHEKIRYALEDRRRMDELERGECFYLGIIASVNLDGAEVGTSSLWGIESYIDLEYMNEIIRAEAHEAIASAKGWMRRNLRGAM